MPKAAGHILKGEDVKLEGQFHLDVAQAQSPTGGQKEKNAALVTPQVRIVENHPEFAVIEITCCCGERTYLKCEYAGAQAPEGSKTQNGQGSVPDQTPDKTK